MKDKWHTFPQDPLNSALEALKHLVGRIIWIFLFTLNVALKKIISKAKLETCSIALIAVSKISNKNYNYLSRK